MIAPIVPQGATYARGLGPHWQGDTRRHTTQLICIVFYDPHYGSLWSN